MPYTAAELKNFLQKFKPRNDAIELLVGPSGIGKNWVVKKLQKTHRLLLSTISRPKRPGEINGADYNFVSEQKFLEFLHRGEMATAFTLGGYYYGYRGTDLQQITKLGFKPIAIIYPFVLDEFLAKFPNSKIRLMFPSNKADYLKFIKKRLKNRHDSEQAYQQRIDDTVKQMQAMYQPHGSLRKYFNDPRAKFYTIDDNKGAKEVINDIFLKE
jgi:guanylate kinase